MNIFKKSSFFSINDNRLSYRLKIAFGFFFLIPATGFVHFAVKYDLLTKHDAIYYILAFYALVFVGVAILREMVKGVETVADNVAREVAEMVGDPGFQARDELEEIVASFERLTRRLEDRDRSLQRRVEELRAIRDLNHLSFAISDTSTLFSRALERAVQVTGAMGGAVFALNRGEDAATLVMKARMGRGFVAGTGDIADLAEHPARFSLERHAPDIVEPQPADGWSTIFTEEVARIVSVPLPKKGEDWGIAALCFDEGTRPSEEILDFLTPFFSTVGVSLEMEEMGLKERESAQELRAVLGVMKLINSGLSGLDMMEALARS